MMAMPVASAKDLPWRQCVIAAHYGSETMTILSPADKSVSGSPTPALWKRPETFLVALMAMACLAGLVLSTPTDPDLWGHVAFGRDIVREGAVPRVDTYSFTSDRPWINHEWLSEVLMYLAYATAGGAGLMGLKVLVCLTAAILVVRQLIRYPLTFEVRVLLCIVAVVGTKAQTGHVRPQLFCVFLFALLLTALSSAAGGDVRALFLIPAIFLFWANLHGGWIGGAGVLGIWTAIQVFDSRRSPSYRRNCVVATVAAAAATLANPYGIRLWTFLLDSVRLDRADITDWQPVTYSIDILLVWIFVAAACAVLLLRARKMPPLFVGSTLGLLAIGSFRVLRLESFFALGAALLLPSVLAPIYTPLTSTRSPEATVPRGASLAVIAVASLAMAAFGLLVVRNGSCIRIETVG